MGRRVRQELLDFDIDKYLNPFIPRNRLDAVTKPVSRFLGYRNPTEDEIPPLYQWILTFLATVGGLCLVGGIYSNAPGIAKWHPPSLVASLGASAVLDYNAVRSPLAQPRNVIIGHTLAAIIGVGISKLFQLNPEFENIQWVAGAVGCACSSVVMSITKTVHPPGGATAVLASTQKQIIAMGWMFPPLILLASVLMTTVACIFNNTLRQYPVYWWSPEDVGGKLPSLSCGRARRQVDEESGQDGLDTGAELEQMASSSSEHTLNGDLSHHVEFVHDLHELKIGSHRIEVPKGFELDEHETAVLEMLRARISKQTHAS